LGWLSEFKNSLSRRLVRECKVRHSSFQFHWEYQNQVTLHFIELTVEIVLNPPEDGMLFPID
jgi:hypothetical protein